MVDVDAVQRHRAPGLAAVLAARDVGPGRVDRFGVLRVDEDLVVVPGIAAAETVIVRAAAAAALRCALRPFTGGSRGCRRCAGRANRAARRGWHRLRVAAATATEATASAFVNRPADPRPRPARIVRAEEAALAALRGHERVDRVRVLRIDPE